MARLEVQVPTVKALFSKNVGFCAFPGCKVATVKTGGPSKRPTVNVEIAHIHAAEQGGARFNPDQSDDDRRAFDNLLLLCPNHHRNHVDKEWPNEFDAAILRRYKAISEETESGTELDEDAVETVLSQYRSYYHQDVGSQTAGNIVNAETAIVHAGFSPDDVRNMLDQQSRTVLEAYTAGANAVARDRIDRFDSGVSSMFTDPKLHAAVQEPSFHRSVGRAQEAAACVSEEDQIDVLVSLLAERADPDTDSTARIAIDRAYSIVSEARSVSIDMLTGVFLAQRLNIPTLSISHMAVALEQRLSPFLTTIPDDNRWVEEVNMLGAVDLNSSQTFKPIIQYWRLKMPGLVAAEFESDQGLGSPDITPSSLGAPLFSQTDQGRFRLNIGLEHSIRASLTDALVDETTVKRTLKAICAHTDAEALKAFEQQLSNGSVLSRFAAYYRQLPFFSISPVGRAAIYANMKRRGLAPSELGIGKVSDLV